MAHIDRYICNECGVEKGAANGWYLINITDGVLSLFNWQHPKQDCATATLHLCGQKCVLARVDRFMSGGKAE